MSYKVVLRGDPTALKSRKYQCGECGHEDVYLVRSAEDNPSCCDKEMLFVYDWVGGDDGLSGGFFYSQSMTRDFSSNKEMKDHVLSQRKHKPGEKVYREDGSYKIAAPLYNESAEKVHGARNDSHLDFGKKAYFHTRGK